MIQRCRLEVQVPWDFFFSFFTSNFIFLWRQCPKISVFRLRVALSWLKIIWNFSQVHREQIPVMGEYFCPLSIIFHSTLCFILFFFRSQICVLNVVAPLLLLYLKEVLWFDSLALKLVEHKPT